MNTKMSRRQKDIKSKLMAAIAMLLVSSIMMVSTTYAWFTLSTAPEVTGISTSVGANGNLEMALLPKSGEVGNISSDVGDSMEHPTVKNTTWGNLVDLSDNSFYGLDKIQLYPAELNITDRDAMQNPKSMDSTVPLKTPVYGADGRVKEVIGNTILSNYDNGAFMTTNSGYGVRAAGSASGMTARQLDYRNSQSAATSAMNSAVSQARKSLNDNGGALAGIAIKKVGESGATYTLADVQVLQAMVNGVSGAVEYIQKAYNQYFLAIGASAAAQNIETGTPDEGKTEYIYLAISGLVNSSDKSQEEILDELVSQYASQIPGLSEMITARVTELKAMSAKIEGVQTALQTLADQNAPSYAWSDLSTPLSNLVNMDKLTINGLTIAEVQADPMVLALNMGSGLFLEMPSGSGIFADIADYCGDYNVQVKLSGTVTVAGQPVDLSKLENGANMATKGVSPCYLSVMGGLAADKGAPAGSGNNEIQPLSEMYGYVIDLAFRTNAASSNLLLQTEAAGRIYDESDSNEETMGHGSTMTFTGTEGFPAEKVAALMEHIRIVFFDPSNGSVYGTAKLFMKDVNGVDKYTVGEDNMTVTADIKMYTIASGEPIVSYVEKTDAVEGTAEYVACYGGYRKAGVATHKLVAEDTYEPATEGATHALGTEENTYVDVANDVAKYVRVETTPERGVETWLVNDTTSNVMNAVITPLTQNTAQAVSVLVYLDGKTITNTDVAIGASSATGTMNLQFASSANLVPMNYANLMGTGVQETEPAESQPATEATEPTT